MDVFNTNESVGGNTLTAGTIDRILEWVAFGDASK